MCCCHDKRLRISRLLCDRFPQYLSLFCFFVLFSQNGRLFIFLRNINSSIEILKIKILEYSYPPSQYFFVTKAFIRFLLCRRKVALCQSGRMAHTHAGKAGVKSHTILLMISSDTDALAVHVDNRSHEEASKGISSAGEMSRVLRGSFFSLEHGRQKGLECELR